MKGFSIVTAVGNLVRDPEVRTTTTGTPVANLRLAINRAAARDQETPVFIDVTLFGSIAACVRDAVRKGDPILVSGRLALRQWTDAAGTSRTRHEIVADQVVFLRPRLGGETDDR